MKRALIYKSVLSTTLALLVGWSSSLITTPLAISSWYYQLQQPFFSPPNWIFAPVWTLLYIMMAIAAALIWQQKKTKLRDQALKVYLFQLGLNYLWSLIFFGLKLPWLAFGEIIILAISIIWTIKLFQKISLAAAFLLYPYLAWVSFASILNLSLALLN